MILKLQANVVVFACLCFFVPFALAENVGQRSDPGMEQKGENAGQDMNKSETIMTKDPQLVTQVQQALSNQGFYNGPIDGKWNSDTQTGLKKYQQALGMSPTGQLDQQTLALLKVQGGAAAGGTQDMSSQETGTGGKQSPTPEQQSGSMRGGPGWSGY